MNRQPDRIFVRDLRVRGIVGVDESERRERQELRIGVEIDADTRRAAESDSLADTLDYRALSDAVTAYVESSSHNLLESLAEGIAATCLARGASVARVRVEKPGALSRAAAAGVVIERRRESA